MTLQQNWKSYMMQIITICVSKIKPTLLKPQLSFDITLVKQYRQHQFSVESEGDMTFMLDWLWNRSWDSRAGQSPGLLGGRHDVGLDTNMTRKTMLLVRLWLN